MKTIDTQYLKSTFDDMFWPQFLKKTWNKRPTVYDGTIPTDLSTALEPSAVFAGLKTLCRRVIQERIFNSYVRVYVDDGEVGNEDMISPLLIAPEDEGFAAFSSRISQSLNGRPWGLVFNSIHVFNEPLLKSIRSHFHGLFRHLGIPLGHLSIDCFAGTYSRTPFGIHKDELHVFTFPILNDRELILWKFADLLPVAPWLRRQFSDLEQLKHRQSHRLGITYDLPAEKKALKLRANPGQIMYWPPSFWHVLKGDKSFRVSIAVGFCIEPTEKQFDLTLPSFNFNRLSSQLSNPSGRLTKALNQWKKDISIPDIHKKLVIRTHQLRSSSGFWPPLPKKLGSKLTWSSNIRVDPRFPIVSLTQGKWMLFFLNGHKLSVRSNRRLSELIRLLCSGRTFSVKSLYDDIHRLRIRAHHIDEKDYLRFMKEIDVCHVFADLA